MFLKIQILEKNLKKNRMKRNTMKTNKWQFQQKIINKHHHKPVRK